MLLFLQTFPVHNNNIDVNFLVAIIISNSANVERLDGTSSSTAWMVLVTEPADSTSTEC